MTSSLSKKHQLQLDWKVDLAKPHSQYLKELSLGHFILLTFNSEE